VTWCISDPIWHQTPGSPVEISAAGLTVLDETQAQGTHQPLGCPDDPARLISAPTRNSSPSFLTEPFADSCSRSSFAGSLNRTLLTALRRIGKEAYHLSMSRIHPECHDSDPSDRLPADVLLRQEPDQEDDEGEDDDDGKEKENDDDDGRTDDGYSE
jgi:hypothetical protein